MVAEIIKCSLNGKNSARSIRPEFGVVNVTNDNMGLGEELRRATRHQEQERLERDLGVLDHSGWVHCITHIQPRCGPLHDTLRNMRSWVGESQRSPNLGRL